MTSRAGQRYLSLIVLLFLLSVPAVTTRIYASDEVQYFAFLRSLWFDRDVSFENEYRHFYDAGIARSPGYHETLLTLESATGRRISFATIGSALLWTPFYAVADLGVLAARSFGSVVPRDGYSWPYVAAVCYGSMTYALLGLLLSIRAAVRLGIDPGAAGLGALAIWLGTPLLFYSHIAPVMAHATAAFCVALFVVVWLEVRDTWSVPGCVALGAVGALMMMVREQDVTFIAGPVVDFTLRHVTHSERGHRLPMRTAAAAAGAATLAFAITFVPQGLAYLALNGRLGPPQLVSRKMNWLSPHAWDILGSPQHGFFLWTPLAVLALGGLVLVARRLARPAVTTATAVPGPALPLLAMFACQVYLLGSLESWTSAGAFGQRRFVSSTVLLVIGLSGLLAAAERHHRHAVALSLVALTAWWNLALIAQFGSGLMDRQRLDLLQNARHAFVTVPAMAPQLARRYLFDRSSFYRNPDRLGPGQK